MEERSLFLSWWLKPSLWRAFLHNWHILLLQLSYLKTPQIGKRYLWDCGQLLAFDLIVFQFLDRPYY